jgi:hypothetical protein
MSASQPSNHSARRKQEAQSVDLVQRVVISALVAVVFGTFAAVLAAYLAIAGDRDLPPTSVIGLWTMTGVMGLGTAAGNSAHQPAAPLQRLGPSRPPPHGDLGSLDTSLIPYLGVEVCCRPLVEIDCNGLSNRSRRAEVPIIPARNGLYVAH